MKLCLHRNVNFFNFVIFRDGAYFELDSFVKTQIVKSRENSWRIMGKEIRQHIIIIWWGFGAGVMIELYFFKIDVGNAVKVDDMW